MIDDFSKYDLSDVVGADNYQPKEKIMTHNMKMGLGLAVLFLVGGLNALHDYGNLGQYIDLVTTLLLGLEHVWSGNTGV